MLRRDRLTIYKEKSMNKENMKENLLITRMSSTKKHKRIIQLTAKVSSKIKIKILEGKQRR
jgi:hypothetical protein